MAYLPKLPPHAKKLIGVFLGAVTGLGLAWYGYTNKDHIAFWFGVCICMFAIVYAVVWMTRTARDLPTNTRPDQPAGGPVPAVPAVPAVG